MFAFGLGNGNMICEIVRTNRTFDGLKYLYIYINNIHVSTTAFLPCIVEEALLPVLLASGCYNAWPIQFATALRTAWSVNLRIIGIIGINERHNERHNKF